MSSVLTQLVTWIFNTLSSFLDAMVNSWGYLGGFIVATFFLNRVVKFIKRMF